MNKKLDNLEEKLDGDSGRCGIAYHAEALHDMDEALRSHRVGKAIRLARESKKLTQAELGARMGVQRAQVCRIESGKSITLNSMMRAFSALGVQCSLDMKGIGSVML